MDNTVELQALRTSVQHLSSDIGQLVVSRNVAIAEAAKLGAELSSVTGKLTAAEAKVKELTGQVERIEDHLKNVEADLMDAEHEIQRLEDKLDGATRYMSAENALAFTTDGDPVPADSSGR